MQTFLLIFEWKTYQVQNLIGQNVRHSIQISAAWLLGQVNMAYKKVDLLSIIIEYPVPLI